MAKRDDISDLIRGNVDAIVLNVIDRSDSYGYEILKDIAERAKGAYEMKEPSLYASLKRLEKQGLIEGYWGSETQGARRKYYRILDAGKDELLHAKMRWVETREIVDTLLETKEAAR